MKKALWALALFMWVWAISIVMISCVTAPLQMGGQPTPQPTATPTTTPPPTTPAVSLPWDGKHADSAKWTAHLINEIELSSLTSQAPPDLVELCPKYASLNTGKKVEVWANLVAKMAQRESNFKPETQYQESFKDASGQYVVSRGLLQLSQESANGYGCGITKATMLHDSFVNLSCGVKIIDRWVGRDKMAMGRISNDTSSRNVGCGRYWAVCRPTNAGWSVIRSHISALSFCK